MRNFFIMLLIVASYSCDKETEGLSPSEISFELDGKSIEYKSSIAFFYPQNDPSALWFQSGIAKDSLIKYRQNIGVSISDIEQIPLEINHNVKGYNSANVFDLEIRFTEVDDDVNISSYVPDSRSTFLKITDVDYRNRFFSGTFSGKFFIMDIYKNGGLSHFRQLPDSFEVKNGHFKMYFEVVK